MPERVESWPISSGIVPERLLAERSSWRRFSNSGQIPAGISPENLFLARIKRCNCLQFLRDSEIGPERELFERSRFWRRGRLQIEGGREPERLLL